MIKIMHFFKTSYQRIVIADATVIPEKGKTKKNRRRRKVQRKIVFTIYVHISRQVQRDARGESKSVYRGKWIPVESEGMLRRTSAPVPYRARCYQWTRESARSVAVTVLNPIGVLEYVYFRAGALPPTIGPGSIALDSAQNGPIGDRHSSRVWQPRFRARYRYRACTEPSLFLVPRPKLYSFRFRRFLLQLRSVGEESLFFFSKRREVFCPQEVPNIRGFLHLFNFFFFFFFLSRNWKVGRPRGWPRIRGRRIAWCLFFLVLNGGRT